MAQYAGRASVSLNTHLFFRGRTQEENGYILFVRKNALQILIPKFGLEGTIYLSGKKGTTHKSGVQFVFDEEVIATTKIDSFVCFQQNVINIHLNCVLFFSVHC